MSESELLISTQSSLGRERGQVVLEYILLLIVVIGLSAIILRNLVGTSDSPAGIRAVWVKLIQSIGDDLPGQ